MEAVSNLTKFDFDKVYEMPAIDFLQYISYINYKNRKQEQELKKWQAQNRIRK